MSGAQRWKSCGLSTYPVLLPTCPSPICFLECSPRLIKTDTAEVKHGGKREREKQKDERSDSAFGAPVQPTLEMSSQGKSKTGPPTARGEKNGFGELCHERRRIRARGKDDYESDDVQHKHVKLQTQSVAVKSKARLQPPRTHARTQKTARFLGAWFSNRVLQYSDGIRSHCK